MPEAIKSMRSMISNNSSGSKTDGGESFTETDNHCFFTYKKNVIYANKHPVRMKLMKQDVQRIKTVRF